MSSRMRFFLLLLAGLVVSCAAFRVRRIVGGPCSNSPGVCMHDVNEKAKCEGSGGHFVDKLCPFDPAWVRCCVPGSTASTTTAVPETVTSSVDPSSSSLQPVTSPQTSDPAVDMTPKEEMQAIDETAPDGVAQPVDQDNLPGASSMTPLEEKYRNGVQAFLMKYKGSIEGAADGRFNELFPTIKQTRESVKGYTTCIDFAGKAQNAGKIACNCQLAVPVNIYLFNLQLRKQKLKGKLPPGGFIQALNPGQAAPTNDDTGAVYVNMCDDRKLRPKPGDVMLMAFANGQFSHMANILSIEQQPGSSLETWITVDGGQGCARCGQEAVMETRKTLDVCTNEFQGGVANQNGGKRRLQGWADISKLLK